MELNININTESNCNCKINIEDISTTYLSEDSTFLQKGSFKKSETKGITLLYLNTLENPSIKSVEYTNEISIKFDGWFTVYYIVLPTKEWFQDMLTKYPDFLGVYEIIYFIDGSQLYKYIPESEQIFSVSDYSELIEINTVNTTISKINKDYVSICFLQKCYINLCQQILESRGFTQCANKNNIDSELIYKRDLVWMGINIIKYLVECNQLYESERIIELLHSCNGVCNDENVKSSSNGCGCS